MKISCILFTVFTLNEIVKGAWWVAATQPIILSLGAAFGALNLDLQPIVDNLLIFKKDKQEKEDGEVKDALKSFQEYLNS